MIEGLQILLAQLLQGTAGFMVLWVLGRRSIRKMQSGVSQYDVLSRESRRCAVRSVPYFNWPAGLMYSSFFVLGLPLLIWRYGTYRTLGLVLLPFAAAFAVPQVLHAFMSIFRDSSAGNVEPSLFWFFVARSLIGLGVAWHDSQYHQLTLLKRGWLNIGTYQAKSKKLAILISRFSSS